MTYGVETMEGCIRQVGLRRRKMSEDNNGILVIFVEVDAFFDWK